MVRTGDGWRDIGSQSRMSDLLHRDRADIQAALEKENEELETTMDGKLSSWTRHLASLESTELDQTIPPAVTA